MAVVVEPRVGEEKLRELLAFGAEAPSLDYKETCDLSAARDRAELAKDVGAMQVDGGFIVIGATSSGIPSGRLTEVQARQFDEARLRDILKRWVPVPLDLLLSVHCIDGSCLVLIYVAPSPAGLCIFKADGQYPNPQARPINVFREGDVYVRDGTQSRRWQQPDIARILGRIRTAEKERWRAEVMPDLQAIMAQGTAAQALSAWSCACSDLAS
jgi:hypothetical protein